MVIQALGGASASRAVENNKNPNKPGGHIMLAGIVFQLSAFPILILLNILLNKPHLYLLYIYSVSRLLRHSRCGIPVQMAHRQALRGPQAGSGRNHRPDQRWPACLPQEDQVHVVWIGTEHTLRFHPVRISSILFSSSFGKTMLQV